MALRHTASSENRVVTTALSTTYARRKIYGQWSYVDLNITTTYTSAWEYVRRATKTYKYVGLDETTANSTAAALRTYYTRTTKTSEFDTDSSSQTFGQFHAIDAGAVPMADVVCQHEDGAMWSVVVSVNEEDTRISLSPSESVSALFILENARGYDTGSSAPT